MPAHLRRVLRGPLLLACLAGCLSFAAMTGSASAASDVEATLIAVPGTYNFGLSSSNPVRYELTVTNNGSDASPGVPFYFYANETLRGMNGDCYFTERLILQNYGTCNIGSLAPGASETKRFTAYIKEPLLVGNLVARANDNSALYGFGGLVGDMSVCRATAVITCPNPPRHDVFV